MRRADELTAEYEALYGEPLELTEVNAGLEWTKRFLQNDPSIMASDTRVAEADGARQATRAAPTNRLTVFANHIQLIRTRT